MVTSILWLRNRHQLRLFGWVPTIKLMNSVKIKDCKASIVQIINPLI